MLSACSTPGSDCRGAAVIGDQQEVVHRAVQRGFQGRVELSSSSVLTFKDESRGAYSITLFSPRGAHEVFRVHDQFEWGSCSSASGVGKGSD
jgi:hypothetical protein